MSLIRKHVAVLQAWACLDLVAFAAADRCVYLCWRDVEFSVRSGLVRSFLPGSD